MMSLKRLAAFIPNEKMDQARTSSRPRYDAGKLSPRMPKKVIVAAL